MSGIAVISNPKSGANRRNPALVQQLAYVLGNQGELAQPKDLDHLEDTIKELRARDVSTICVSGGDGTLHKVLSALVRVYCEGLDAEELRRVRLPSVAILRSGTVNTISRNIGLRTGAEEMLGRVVAAAHGGPALRTVERSLVVVNRRHAGFIFGVGVLARFMEAYYAGGSTGPMKAIWVLTKTVISGVLGTAFSRQMFARAAWRVEVDGRSFGESSFAALAIGSVRDIGLGFKLWRRALDDPEKMHVLGFACDPMRVIRLLPSIYFGRPLAGPGVLEALPFRVTIEHTEPVDIMMDGDFIEGCQSLEVETGPRVRFLVP